MDNKPVLKLVKQQKVEAYVKDTIGKVAVEIQDMINAGWRVVSCSYQEHEQEYVVYNCRALVVYEKEEPVKTEGMSTGVDWSSECTARPWPHLSEPDIDIDVKSGLPETIKDYIQEKYGAGSTGIVE